MKLTPIKIDCGLFFHHGLMDEFGMVYHNSKRKGRVVYETLEDFSDGFDVFFSNIEISNPHAAIEKAKTYLGAQYDLFSKNCEHFVRVCAGLDEESPQIQKFLCVSGGLAIAATSESGLGKAVGLISAGAALFTPTDKSPIPNVAMAALLTLGIGLFIE